MILGNNPCPCLASDEENFVIKFHSIYIACVIEGIRACAFNNLICFFSIFLSSPHPLNESRAEMHVFLCDVTKKSGPSMCFYVMLQRNLDPACVSM